MPALDRCLMAAPTRLHRPTQASLDLLNKIIQRVESEKGWDQAIFNEVIFMPSRPGYEASRRLGEGVGRACTGNGTAQRLWTMAGHGPLSLYMIFII